MAYSESMANPDYNNWSSFRSCFTDSWMSTHENETLTKALQKSLSSSDSEILISNIDPINNNNGSNSNDDYALFHQQFVNLEASIVSGSDAETTSKRRNPISGKISKRKSRATKRSPVTFIMADPVNFRDMVQQVTGIRFNGSTGGNSQLPVVLSSSSSKDSKRTSELLLNSYTLPTLDTSAFFLDHQNLITNNQHQQQRREEEQEQVVAGPTVKAASNSNPGHDNSYVPVSQGGMGLDFDSSFPNFPTLESWGVI